jgi:hypothetical protein
VPEIDDAGTPDRGVSTPDKGVSTPDKGVSTPDKGVSTPDKGPVVEQEHSVLAGEPLPEPLWRAAAPVRDRKRSDVAQVRETILALCAQRYLTLRELSMLLGRSSETLREQYLTPMLREGALELRFPDARKHPMQAYTTRTAGHDPDGECE